MSKTDLGYATAEEIEIFRTWPSGFFIRLLLTRSPAKLKRVQLCYLETRAGTFEIKEAIDMFRKMKNDQRRTETEKKLCSDIIIRLEETFFKHFKF